MGQVAEVVTPEYERGGPKMALLLEVEDRPGALHEVGPRVE